MSLRAKGAPRCTAHVGEKKEEKNPERPNKTSPRPFLSLIYPSRWIKSRSLKRLQGRGEGSAARVDAATVKSQITAPSASQEQSRICSRDARGVVTAPSPGRRDRREQGDMAGATAAAGTAASTQSQDSAGFE